jgi:hypothetical protein
MKPSDASVNKTWTSMAVHLVGVKNDQGYDQLRTDKLQWIEMVPETLENAQAVFQTAAGNFNYIRKYAENKFHVVVTSPSGELLDFLVTQFPTNQKEKLRGATLVAFKTEPISGAAQSTQAPLKRKGSGLSPLSPKDETNRSLSDRNLPRNGRESQLNDNDYGANDGPVADPGQLRLSVMDEGAENRDHLSPMFTLRDGRA